MTEVDNHFSDAGFHVLHGVGIEISPLVCVNGGTGHDHGIQNYVLFGEYGEKLGWSIGNSDNQKRQFVFVDGLDVHAEDIRLGKNHPHMAVQMRGINSYSDGPLNFYSNFSLRAVRLDNSGRSDDVV